ncbi:hypothetical protein ACFOYU_20885, partial [Microvirga sp. GCM10011540]
YTKVTYGLVALAFLVFMLFDARQRRWAAWAIGLTILTALAVEILWKASLAHFADLVLAGQVSGTRGAVGLVLGFLRHLADYVMFGIVAVLALWRTRSFRDFLFFGFCAGPGLLIQAQNSQPWGIITLHTGAVVAAEILVRTQYARTASGGGSLSLASGSVFLLFALLLPTTVHYLLGLGLHTTLAVTRSGQPFGLPGLEQVRLARLWTPGDYAFTSAYLESIRKGGETLAELPTRPRQVSVLDFANPFSAGLNLPPPRGDNAWLHWGRNINTEHHLPPNLLFKDVEILMEPKWGVNPGPLRSLYGTYIESTFEPVRETDAWIVWHRRDSRAGEMAESRTSSGSCPAEQASASRVGAGDGCSQ